VFLDCSQCPVFWRTRFFGNWFISILSWGGTTFWKLGSYILI
jgi:hypothetical protein